MTRATRAIAWTVLLALAAFQAYSQRFVIGPDGVSYLDLSDAVVTGNWGRLLNLYWSPLYPMLIGIGRLVTGVGPQHEIPLVHAVNFACFVAMLAAFEYLLGSMLSIALRVRHSVLGGRWGGVVAYTVFGAFSLTMIPLELTTPDLLNAAFVFTAFGAMLRLRDDSERATRHAIVFGAALGLAGLAKSFMIPWGVICFVVLGFALRRERVRPLVPAAAAWLIFVLPWSVALSMKAGRPTFGDAGRLTYAWFVNHQDAPSLGGVPPDARTERTESILPGAGVANDTAYTDPMWADPARWNASLRANVQASDQLETMGKLHSFYVENFAPLLFLVFFIAISPRPRREIWSRGWIIYVPALAGLIAYAMVLVTSRYVMPFVVSGTLVLLAATPVARRLVPKYALIGLAIPIALEALVPNTVRSLWLLNSVIGGTLAAALFPARSAIVWMPIALGAMIATRIFLPPSLPDLLRVGGASLAVLFWRAAYIAVRSGRTVAFAHRAQMALAFSIGMLFVYRLSARFDQDNAARIYASKPKWGNVQWNIAQDLAARGVTPGTRIAVIGPHAESYWARTARLHIVASVPRNRIAEFWLLPKPQQDELLAEFAANGATVAIASLAVVGLPPDSSWTRMKYRGRLRALAAVDSLR